MIRIALCDDAASDLKQLQTALKKWVPSVQYTVESFSDGDALIQSHSTTPFDIIFLDVVMPLINGIDTAKEIRLHDKNVKLVFLTSSIEYAYESYSVKASNYLLKPVDEKKLTECLDELCHELSRKEKTLSISASGISYRISLQDIETLEAQNKHVLSTLKNGRKLVSNEPLYSYEKILLEEGFFFKCHRSYIINLYLIDSYTSKEIRMRTSQIIPLSRNLHKEFEQMYFSTLFMKEGEDA